MVERKNILKLKLTYNNKLHRNGHWQFASEHVVQFFCSDEDCDGHHTDQQSRKMSTGQ